MSPLIAILKLILGKASKIMFLILYDMNFADLQNLWYYSNSIKFAKRSEPQNCFLSSTMMLFLLPTKKLHIKGKHLQLKTYNIFTKLCHSCYFLQSNHLLGLQFGDGAAQQKVHNRVQWEFLSVCRSTMLGLFFVPKAIKNCIHS